MLRVSASHSSDAKFAPLIYAPAGNFAATFEHETGVQTTVTSTDCRPVQERFLRIEAQFEKSRFTADGIGESNVAGTLTRDPGGRDVPVGRATPRDFSLLFKRSLADFVKALRARGRPAADAEDGLRAVELETAIAESARRGRAVEPERARI